MGRFEKYRGKVNFEVDGEKLDFDKLTVEDKGRLVSASKDNNYEKMLGIMRELMLRHYPNEPKEEIDAFLLSNSEVMLIELLSAFGLANRDEAMKSITDLKAGKDFQKAA